MSVIVSLSFSLNNRESLQLVYDCLRNSDNNQAEQIIKLIKNWEKENKPETVDVI